MGDTLKQTLAPVVVQTVKTLADSAINELTRTIAHNVPYGQPVSHEEAARLLAAELTERSGEVPASAPLGGWLDDAGDGSALPSSGALAAGEALAADGAVSENRVRLADMYQDVASVRFLRDETLTIALVRLHNGFALVGHSACVDPANYDQVKGETFAFEHAMRQLWPLKGFALADANYRADIGQ